MRGLSFLRRSKPLEGFNRALTFRPGRHRSQFYQATLPVLASSTRALGRPCNFPLSLFGSAFQNRPLRRLIACEHPLLMPLSPRHSNYPRTLMPDPKKPYELPSPLTPLRFEHLRPVFQRCGSGSNSPRNNGIPYFFTQLVRAFTSGIRVSVRQPKCALARATSLAP